MKGLVSIRMGRHRLLSVFMVRCVLIVAIFCESYNMPVFGQYENVWAFGYNAGIDFNVNPPAPIVTGFPNVYQEGVASICDENGVLLFYTNGYLVFDRNHFQMPNGSDLTNGLGDLTWSTSQGSVIVPVPGSSSRFYIFSLAAHESARPGSLYYSVVDMELNNGLGDIVVAERGILLDTGLTEQMTSVAVEGRCGVWLLVSSKLDYSVKAYSISANGIDPNPVVSPGLILGSTVAQQAPMGNLIVSPDRKRLAYGRNGLVLFDFNAVSGQASNPILLSDVGLHYSCAFSLNNSKLYSSAGTSVFQYDLTVPPAEVPLSVQVINVNSLEPHRNLKLASDGKIYCGGSYNGNAFFDIIEYPDLYGSACQYQQNAFQLAAGTGVLRGLPNVVSVPLPDTIYNQELIQSDCFENYLSFSATDTSGWDYQWDNGDTIVTRRTQHSGTYWVRYRTPCEYHIDTFYVSFSNGVLPAVSSGFACRGDSNGSAYATTYPGDPVRYTYTWLRGNDTLSVSDTLSDVPSDSYSLHVQTDTGCDTLLYFNIPEADFRVSFTSSDTLICLGDTLQFENTSDDHFTAFYWDMDNGDRYPLGEPAGYRYSESGAYRVMLAGEGEICRDTTYQTIVVDQPLVPRFDVVPKEVCAGQPVYLSPFADSTTTQIQWELPDQVRKEGAIERHYQHAFDQPGIFAIRLDVQSRACPDTSYTDSIHVYPLPVVDLGRDTSICLHGQPVYLKNLRDAPLDPYHHVWSTGDTTEVLKVVHPGIYTLSVIAEPIGCTTTETIEIKKDCYIDVPNVFTPNGDGHNDHFFPRQLLSESVNRFHMQVFNRWGQIVFETNRLDGGGWDGHLNGKQQPMGVYVYRIDVDFANGRQEQYEGDVTLLW